MQCQQVKKNCPPVVIPGLTRHPGLDPGSPKASPIIKGLRVGARNDEQE